MRFTLDDFAKSMRQLQRIARWRWLLRRILPIPAKFYGNAEDQQQRRRLLAMISAMTPQERHRPELIGRSRTQRIARGSGNEAYNVRELVRSLLWMKDQGTKRRDERGDNGDC